MERRVRELCELTLASRGSPIDVWSVPAVRQVAVSTAALVGRIGLRADSTGSFVLLAPCSYQGLCRSASSKECGVNP
ncbi:unnamed protein product [Prunus armeniaca]|uniref:Uncharacterized protein n=1 Tax=Prunus armeniaca TaxID=36596 RepID=A0A6J5XMX6_PRUAR|nr:unnamed protein product [Prunus armeniaca]CAB4313733.1 unnamed protein product [Prunus armeniaca]